MFQLHTHYHCIVQCLRVPPPFPLVQLFKLFPPSCGWKKCHILLTPSLSPPLPPKESVLVERVFWAASSLRDCCKSAPLFLALWSSSGSSGARLQLPCLFACSSWRFCNQGTATFTATAMQGKWSHFAALLWLLLGMGGGGVSVLVKVPGSLICILQENLYTFLATKSKMHTQLSALWFSSLQRMQQSQVSDAKLSSKWDSVFGVASSSWCLPWLMLGVKDTIESRELWPKKKPTLLL